MNTEDLKEYLGIVVDMEKSIYLQKSLLENIKLEIWRLKTPAVIKDPVEPSKRAGPPEPQRHKPPHSILGIIGGFVGWFFAGGFGGLLLGEIVHDNWPILLSLICPIIWTIVCIRENNEALTEYTEKMLEVEEERKKISREYRKKKEEYQKALEEAQAKRQEDEKERELKTLFFRKQKEAVEKSMAASEKHLQAVYEKNIVFPKYRNLVMVCSLYEYICAGRCTELEGYEGAYNILEAEIRLDRIVTELNRIINNLEKIEKNQFMLYSAVQAANQRLGQILESNGRMVASLNDVRSNFVRLNEQVIEISTHSTELNAHIAELQKTSALTAYQTERAQKELAYMNRMNYLSGKNDEVFWNHPPV